MSTDGRDTNENKRVGTSIEKYRADQRGGQRTPEAWFDVEDGDQIVEVKSTERRLDSGRRGRYQLVEEQHENLLDHGGVYDFVLRDGDSTATERVGVPASTVEDVLDQHDLKWPRAGKLKLPWAYVHDPADVPGEGEP